MNACPHRAKWTQARGAARCEGCGVVRFTDYAALRPPGLPYAVTASQEHTRRVDLAVAARVAWNTRRPGRWFHP
ncbi:DUF6255 family natural product biosynthesis protein [Streptomyces sp. NPDC051162]|uniref:DUF6255 family natural product biosynthesis protein n=1 Tax=unclassified Streptomyces TaxID=2593676 RepID=UPI0034281BBC